MMTQELEGSAVGLGQVSRGDEGVGNNSAVGRRRHAVVGRGRGSRAGGLGVLEVQGDVGAPERAGGQGVEGLLGQAGAGSAGVQRGDVVQDGEGTGGNWCCISVSAGVVLDTMTNGDGLQSAAGVWCWQVNGCVGIVVSSVTMV